MMRTKTQAKSKRWGKKLIKFLVIWWQWRKIKMYEWKRLLKSTTTRCRRRTVRWVWCRKTSRSSKLNLNKRSFSRVRLWVKWKSRSKTLITKLNWILLEGLLINKMKLKEQTKVGLTILMINWIWSLKRVLVSGWWEMIVAILLCRLKSFDTTCLTCKIVAKY